MRFNAASCFSGIGAPELGGPQFDWRWSAEFEKTPSRVLAQRHPQSINLGDVTAEDFIERALAFGPLDLLAGGPPCQAFSFAGLRKSLSDARGNLSLRFVEIAHAIRPRFLLVENVPGWLSTDDNAFGCFLGAIVGGDAPLCHPKGERWPRVGMVAGPLGRAAWRVFDAQYFGLAQQRQRVFVVVDFGGGDPARVLFERKSREGNSRPRREQGKGFAADVAPSLTASGRGVARTGESRGQDSVVAIPEIAPTLTSNGDNHTGFRDEPGLIAKALLASNGQRLDPETDNLLPVIVGALTEVGGNSQPGDNVQSAAQGYLIPEAVCIHADAIGRDGVSLTESADASGNVRKRDAGLGIRDDEASYALTTGAPHSIAYAIQGAATRENPASGPDGLGAREGLAYTLEARSEVQYAATQYAVRRITPVEAERLQGFPDGFTAVDGGSWRKVSPEMAAYLRSHGGEVVPWSDCTLRTRIMADGPRYKTLGNSWAVDNGRWILDRLAEELAR